MSQVRDDSPEMIRRREVLRRAAWLLGGAVSAPAALAILQGCSAKEPVPSVPAYVPTTLRADHFAVVSEIAEIMIPKTPKTTNSSGARDAGVPAFIDQVLGAVYEPEAVQLFKAGCAEFITAAQSRGNRQFLEQALPERTAYVKHSLETALGDESSHKPFILVVRELALLGFFTSEMGINENMEYVAVPGEFHGCVPVSQLKKPVYWE
jgi:gluconate 2-dehydrogenase gamma chain